MFVLPPGTKILLAIVSTMYLLVAFTSANSKIICPVIQCETTISDFICYQHQAATPVETISTFSCPNDQVCNLETDKYAWVTSKYQVENYNEQEAIAALNKDDTILQFKAESQIYKRYTEKSCEPIENFLQNVNNGQVCNDNRNCMSQNCTRKSESKIKTSQNTFSQCLLDCQCLGAKEENSCTHSYECDVGLACIYDEVFPFASTCQPLRGSGTKLQCHEDTDCELTHYCWYPTIAQAKPEPGSTAQQQNTKQCMEMYSQPDETKFGYRKDPNKQFKYNMQENYIYGRYCKSGLGRIMTENADTDGNSYEMQCVKIDLIKTNKAQSYWKDFKCELTTAEDSCKYYYKDGDSDENLINQERCECSLMEFANPTQSVQDQDKLEELEPKRKFQKDGTFELIPQTRTETIEQDTGMCPFPDQKVLDKFILNYKEMISAAQKEDGLHTDDRYDMRALFTQLVQNKQSSKNETWAEVVQSNFEIEHWPQIQSNQTRTCVDIVVYNSPANLFKLGTVRLSSYLMMILGLSSVYYTY